MSPLAIRLREVRESRGLSQGALAELAGTRQGTVSLLESGKTRRIDLDLIERLARALKVSAADLIVETPAKAAGKKRK